MSKSNYQRTADWLSACGKKPSAPTLSLQIGCDMEEMAEYLACLRLDSNTDAFALSRIVHDLNTISRGLKMQQINASIPDGLREDALDAICDREVTANGVAFFARFDKDAADQAVLGSNDAKLVDGKPVILPGGKIGKPEGWKAPNLSGFV